MLINVYVASPDPDPNHRGGGKLPNPNPCCTIYPSPTITSTHCPTSSFNSTQISQPNIPSIPTLSNPIHIPIATSTKLSTPLSPSSPYSLTHASLSHSPHPSTIITRTNTSSSTPSTSILKTTISPTPPTPSTLSPSTSPFPASTSNSPIDPTPPQSNHSTSPSLLPPSPHLYQELQPHIPQLDATSKLQKPRYSQIERVPVARTI